MRLSILSFLFLVLLSSFSTMASAYDRGIYLTQSTATNTKLLSAFVARAKKYKLNTFVVDLKRPGKKYARAIAYIRKNRIKYVARIVIFPGGAKHKHIINKKSWQSKLSLLQYAAGLKASAIQLDYIRYNTKRGPSQKNVNNIVNIVRFFRHNLRRRVSLQVDVFGMTSFAPMREIGQDIRAMSPYINAVCPMVYPSHYSHPYNKPDNAYNVVYGSLTAMKKQLKGIRGVKIYAFIESSSYRHAMSWQRRVRYMKDQIRAVKKARVAGWYVWSAGNQYAAVYAALAK